MKKILQISLLLIAIFCATQTSVIAQSVTILPGETTNLNYSLVFNGDARDGGGTQNGCFFNKSKGMITLAIEIQSNGFATWPENRVAFWYNGKWHHIFQLWVDGAPSHLQSLEWDLNRFINPVSNQYERLLPENDSITQVITWRTDGIDGGGFIKNTGNLRRYDGNYLPLADDKVVRLTPADYPQYSLQTDEWSATYAYPVWNPAISSGIQAVAGGYDANHFRSRGNLPGVGFIQESPSRAMIYVNIVNLPPDMLESGNFRVHLYQNANTAHDRILEWVYNNQNFMTNAPIGLSATNNLCGKVTLNWSNASNPMPNDGGAMNVKTVIFRNGEYLAMVNGGVTTYDDVTAVQDVAYQYSLNHVAFSQSGKTYFRSPSTATVTGQVKPSPDQPISLAASENTCDGTIKLTWNYNGANPDKFRLEYAMSPTGPFTSATMPPGPPSPDDLIAGSARSFTHDVRQYFGIVIDPVTGEQVQGRGIRFYYRLYAINVCNVQSNSYASTNGISIAYPQIPDNLTATLNASNDAVTVTWADRANNETKYQVVRRDDLGNQVTFEVNPNTTSYRDESVAACRSYTYSVKVFNECVTGGFISASVSTSTIPPPNLNTAFTSAKKLTASKGYFSNRIELSWQNNNGQNIDVFRIYRKINGTSYDSTLIGTAATGSGFYIDNTSDARVYYKYTILGVKYCNGTELFTNVSEDIGFRNPTGNVSGHIEYNGGIALKGAKVIIQQSGGATGSAVKLEGSIYDATPTKLAMAPSQLGLTDQLRVEFWLKPTANYVQSFIEKVNSFAFKRRLNDYEAVVFTGGVARIVHVPISKAAVNQWSHISLQYSGDEARFKVFVNGTPVDSVNATGTIGDPNNSLVIGGGDVSFLMDELRIMKVAASNADIKIDHARYLNTSAQGTVISLRFNENYGRFAYDGSSQNNVFNGHHFEMSGNVIWSSDKPSSGQLSYYGITDEFGNYTVAGIAFSGTGENFTIIPSYLTHSFTPNSRSVYMGDAATVFNNQDFIDNSSFTVTGNLFFKDTSCPVPDAILKIDGQVVVANAEQVKTDANGNFSLQVPIGHHYISIEKFGHTMEVGRFPATGTFDFQNVLSGITFIDSTKRSIVGRVAGGLIEANKVAGLGRSKNNIGQVKVRIVSPIVGVPCFSSEVITDATTGEYRFEVPPLQYRIDSVYVMNTAQKPVLNSWVTPAVFTNTKQVLDLRNVIDATKVVDTLFDAHGGILSIDSTEYHKRHDMIYRIQPMMYVTDSLGGKFIGEKTLTFENTSFSIAPDATHTWGLFGFPVFLQNKKYTAKIHALEIYTNFETNKKDSVKLSGKVVVTNELVDGADPYRNLDLVNGVATYRFECGSPNTNKHALDPDLDYTKTLQINVIPTGATTLEWKPNEGTILPFGGKLFSPPVYRAYVLGQRVAGSGIATQGPEKVEFILRDPPGSQSFATWASGSSIIETSEYANMLGEDINASMTLQLGSKTLQGLGILVETEAKNDFKLGISQRYEDTSSGATTTITTTTQSVSTRNDPDNVGAEADIFVGFSRNWLVGPTLNIELVDANQCGSLIGCFGPEVNGKRMVLKKGYAIAPGAVKTRFAYTQKEIETVVIPNLEGIRNSQLSTANYQAIAAPSHPLYGSNNDDPQWGAQASSLTPEVYDLSDTDGPSYKFTGATIDRDTVRILNNQIALWKRALARNEKEKYECLNNIGVVRSDNFSLGSAVITKSYATDFTTSKTESWELHFSEEAKNEFGIKFSGMGFTQEHAITALQSKSKSRTNGSTNSTTFEYTLTDGNDGDLMGINVYQVPLGNVFIVDGGYTMCPYEDQVVARYYNPADPDGYIGSHTRNNTANGNALIQRATVQREVPAISITPANQYGIPSNQAAVFQLQLSNESVLTTNNDIDFSIRIASQSNPHGAVLKIDGQPANTTLRIPAGGAVIKTLTVERGPVEINYDNLMIIFSSACSSDIADTAYVSAHFIPTCTELKMTSPNDNWVFNNSIDNKANIVVSNYNYNYGAATDNSVNPPVNLGLTKIGLEVRPTSSNTWTEYSAFYKYPAMDQLPIPSNQVYSQYLWDISTLPDGAYELKAISYCLNKDGSYSTVESPIHKGVMDRINPVPFGTPSPGDGILDPQDDISIKFNEPIDIGALTSRNFDVRGVINGGNSRQSESLSFDGVDDYAEVPSGASLQKRSFTFEFWAMLNSTGTNQTVVSQGTDASQRFAIGFDNTNRFTFSIGNQSVASVNPINAITQWHHYAVVYDYSLQTANLYVDGTLVNSGNTSIFSDYNGQGKLVFGKLLPTNTNYFNGNLNDMRLWSKTRTIGEIVRDFNKDLYNNSPGLIHNWKMNEADGTSTHDVIRSRDAVLHGASWRITPNGYAAQFDGIDDRIDIKSSTISITQEMDFTLEFWFKSNQAGVATIFSNGKGDGIGSDAEYAWNIQKDAAGIIHVYHNGYDFVATNKNFFDGQWHHFALVMQRTANLTSYIDGNLQRSAQALTFKQVGGPYMYLGVRGYQTGLVTTYDSHFNGSIDEFRFWNTARKVEQVKRDKQNRMSGDEFGLLAFVPFESYTVDPAGIPILTPTFKDYSTEITSVHTDSVFSRNGVISSSQTPAIKLPRPVGSIDFVTSVNNDQIIITPTTAPALLENVTLDITVKDVYDLHGNKMKSPKTWIAYVNKNQVLWQDIQRSFTKKQDDVVNFNANIVNNGGALKEFAIGNLPSWLTASITSGTLSPNSVKSISFTIAAGTPVGDYDADITLTTDFGYAEVLQINLKVTGEEPVWVVNPSNFQYSMSIVGEIKIDDVIATNTSTKIAAFNKNTLCGVANLTYMQSNDRYVAFLNVYSNEVNGDSITFKVYDATTGITFVNVTPKIKFVENSIVGSLNTPVTFAAQSEISLEIPLKSGWTWISLPLRSQQLQHSNLLMENLTSTENDIVRTMNAYDQYATGLGWIGTISSSTERFANNKMYQVKRSSPGTLVFTGARIHPDDAAAEIEVVPGWNWIGYVATKNSDVNAAMSGYTAADGDILKSQSEFSVYDNNAGWVGSLTTMRPGQGYMLKSTAMSTFHYPQSVFYGSSMRKASTRTEEDDDLVIDNTFNAGAYEKTMSVIAKSNLCSTLTASNNMILAAFDSQNALRGYARPIYNEKTKQQLYYLTAYGNRSGEKLEMRYINLDNGSAISAEDLITFSADTLLGLPATPMTISVASEASCLTNRTEAEVANSVQTYPNPFTDVLNIMFAENQNVTMELTDMIGKVHAVFKSEKESSVTIDVRKLNLKDGVYLLRIRGDVNTTIKVIKKAN